MQRDRPALEAPALHTLRLIARQPWRHCVTSLRSAQWLASSLKLAALCRVNGCWPSCYTIVLSVLTVICCFYVILCYLYFILPLTVCCCSFFDRQIVINLSSVQMNIGTRVWTTCLGSLHETGKAGELKPNSITLASSELAPNMLGASSELVRSWLRTS